MKILLVGHACSPRQGSEPANTWNWAWQLSQNHQVCALAHPHDREGVEDYLAAHPNPNLRFVWVKPPERLDPWNPKQGERFIRVHYIFWQREAYRVASRLLQERAFDLVHHVSWGTVSAPPLLWRLPVPFVWGPVGGGQTTPATFLKYFGSACPKEVLRTLRVRLMHRLPNLQKAAAGSALVLATNRETANILELAGARDVRLFLDAGVTSAFLPERSLQQKPSGPFTLFWAGRLEPRKALPLALEALSRIRNDSIQLMVAGDGPLRKKWEQLAFELGLEGSVTFLGRVPWEKMPELFGRADAFIFTSLRDAFGTQVMEAMAHSLPILTLNHQGVRDFVPDNAGIKVSVTSPEDTVAGLAKGILRLAGSVEERRRMGEFGRKCAEEQSWERRALKMSALYQDVISASARHPQKDFEFRSAAGLGAPVQVEGLSRARTGEDAELRN